MAEWTVVCEPEGSNRGKNQSGLLVLLTDGETKHEVARVAFVRRNSKNPDAEFGEQLEEEVEKAARAADVLNASLDELDRLQTEAAMKAREQVKDILGPKPRWNAKPS